MRILLIHQYFLEKNHSGGSRFNEMTRFWASKGHEITVISGMVHYATGKKEKRYKGKYFFEDLNYYNRVNVVRCHVSETYNSSFLGRLWAYLSFIISSTYAGLFKLNNRFDVILATSPPLFIGVTGIILSKLKKIPLFFEVRDLWPESAIDTGILNNKTIIKFAYWFENYVYKQAKMINVLTPAFRDNLVFKKNVPNEKVIFIPNAADFSLAQKIQNNSNFDAEKFKTKLGFKNKFVITYVGAHGVANHLIQLVDTAEKLTDTRVVFQLIGAGMRKRELQNEVKKRGLKNIIFRDPVSKTDVFKYILASDVGASILKKADAFKTIYSNKTFDYMSCSKPILLAIDGVSKDLIEKSSSGVYVEPENIESIVKGVKILENMSKNELQKMGNSGFLYSKKHFNREYLANKYLKELKNTYE